jgi:rhodanese-related sulfurtransferase
MKRFATALVFACMAATADSWAQEQPLENYISHFDYASRSDMKIDSEALVDGIEEGRIQLVDIRFKEEVDAWRTGFATSIPLNELPERLNELNRDKIIVTACPHKDRAIIAMVFLRTRGFKAKYLVDGLTGLAEYLRGDVARVFVNTVNSK